MALHQLTKVRTVNELHDQPRSTVNLNVVGDRYDVRVAQGCLNPALLDEPRLYSCVRDGEHFMA